MGISTESIFRDSCSYWILKDLNLDLDLDLNLDLDLDLDYGFLTINHKPSITNNL